MIDQFCIKIAIVDLILIIEIQIDVNRQSNLDFRFDSMTLIQFAIPNRISLVSIDISIEANINLCCLHYQGCQKIELKKLLYIKNKLSITIQKLTEF